jgi:periplasmic divalent cation tolerance protein
VSENQCLVVLCTCPGGEPAARLASALVEARLAACVNHLPGLVSTYRWQGEVRHSDEALLIIKTTRKRLAALSTQIRALHPYELPEIIAVPVLGGLEEYLDWIRASVA